MGDRSTSNHRHRQKCTGTSTGTNQQTKRKGHQPSAIVRRAHRTKAITRLPISEGSRQNPDTRDDNSLAQLHSQSYSIFSGICHAMLLSLCNSTGRPTRLQCSSCLQAATLPPKDKQERKKTHLRFRSHADGLASLEHPSIPVATSGPAQSIPTLIDHRQKDPFFFSPAAPYSEAAALARPCLAQDKNSQSHLRLVDHRLASLPMPDPRRLVGNISWCAHRCDVRMDTHLQQQMASRAVIFPHAKTGNTPSWVQPLSLMHLYHPSHLLNLQPGRAIRHQ